MILILIFVIIFFLFFCYNNKIFTDDTVEEYYNGSVYKVRKSSPEEQLKTAKKLDTLKIELKKLVNYCHENELPTKQDANRMYSRFKTIQFNETSSNENSAAYVVNKNEELRICLKNEKENDTMFVLLHELAHVMSESYGHNEEFKKNMDFLVKEAVKLKIYKPIDYSKNPINYCGVNITSTPCHNNQCLVGSQF